jgi:flagellar protein FliS
MNQNAAAQAYKEEAFQNAPPLKIVRLMYQGALRFIDQAAASDPRDPRSPFVERLTRADAVVAELRLALDSGPAPQVAAELERLYLFVESSLQRALLERSVEPLPGARDVLAKLLEAWSQVELEADPCQSGPS